MDEMMFSGIDNFLTLEEDVNALEEAESLMTDTDYIDAVLNVNETKDIEEGALFDYDNE